MLKRVVTIASKSNVHMNDIGFNYPKLRIFGWIFVLISAVPYIFFLRDISAINFSFSKFFDFLSKSAMIALIFSAFLLLFNYGYGLLRLYDKEKSGRNWIFVLIIFDLITILFTHSNLWLLLAILLSLSLAILLTKINYYSSNEIFSLSRNFILFLSIFLALISWRYGALHGDELLDAVVDFSLKNTFESNALSRQIDPDAMADIYVKGITKAVAMNGINLTEEQKRAIKKEILPDIEAQMSSDSSKEAVKKAIYDVPLLQDFKKYMPLLVVLTTYSLITLLSLIPKIVIALFGALFTWLFGLFLKQSTKNPSQRSSLSALQKQNQNDQNQQSQANAKKNQETIDINNISDEYNSRNTENFGDVINDDISNSNNNSNDLNYPNSNEIKN